MSFVGSGKEIGKRGLSSGCNVGVWGIFLIFKILGNLKRRWWVVKGGWLNRGSMGS